MSLMSLIAMWKPWVVGYICTSSVKSFQGVFKLFATSVIKILGIWNFIWNFYELFLKNIFHNLI